MSAATETIHEKSYLCQLAGRIFLACTEAPGKTGDPNQTPPFHLLLQQHPELRDKLSLILGIGTLQLGTSSTPRTGQKPSRELLKQIEDFLQTDSLLQQALAFAVDYVPSRWLLEQEIEVVCKSRRLRFPDDPPPDGCKPLPDGDAYAWARTHQLTGICLSGGGIRSATFNLGVLQGLAQRNILQHCDYISSVSGGGYIHEWLAGWIKREDLRIAACQAANQAAPGSAAANQAKQARSGFASVNEALKPVPADAEHPFTPNPIRWLRRYSNYLTPQKGLFTADTWVAVAIWIRNTFLNQIVLVSFLFALVLLPHILANLLSASHPWFVLHVGIRATLVLAGLLFLVAVGVFCVGLGQELDRVRHGEIYQDSCFQSKAALIGEKAVLYGIVIELLAAAALLTSALQQTYSAAPLVGLYLLLALQLAAMALAGGVIRAYRYNNGYAAPKIKSEPTSWERLSLLFTQAKNEEMSGFAVAWRVVLGAVLSSTVLNSLVAALGAIGLFVLIAASLRFNGCDVIPFSHWHIPGPRWMGGWLPHPHHDLQVPRLPWHLPSWDRKGENPRELWRIQLTLGPPLFLLVPFFGMVLMAGLVGRNFTDWLREWIARVRAWCLLLSLAWVAYFGISLLGPWLYDWFGASHAYEKTVQSIKWTAVLGWMATTAGSVLAGKSKKASGTSADSSTALNLLAEVGPYVFIVGLLILLATAADYSSQAIQGFLPTCALFLGPLAIFALFGWRVDINEFSMNPFYRNRLTRCYLGASNPMRDPSPLTGLDDRDTRSLQIAKLQPSLDPRENYSGPLPIINTTLNISSGADLAYQERKAASFFFSPLFSGYTVGWTSGKKNLGLHFNGFVPTAHFYCPEGGINIATAAAISGAAASPNGGFHTNPGTAFLMTLFNVRLGWWIRNPRLSPNAGTLPNPENQPKEWPSPGFAPAQLINELLGKTDDASAYVYLSDGGHFDNMGLYELVRRRCHRIVICDAESDENYTFEGLGMAIRKCRIDFGVEILLADLSRLRKELKSGICKSHFVLGTIRYPETPLDEERMKATGKTVRKTGDIIYLKSSLTGDARWEKNPKAKPRDITSLDAESADILNYKLQHPTFPHDSTANQWFTESQFESYRRLGQHVVEEAYCSYAWKAFNEVPSDVPPPPPPAPAIAQAPLPLQAVPPPVAVAMDGGVQHRNGNTTWQFFRLLFRLVVHETETKDR